MSIYYITSKTVPQNLVGRYVVKDAGFQHAAVNYPMRVIGVSGKSLEVERAPRWYSDEQSRWVIGHGEGDVRRDLPERLTNVQLRSLYMACDTLEEVDSLVAFSRNAADRVVALTKELERELAAMVVIAPIPPAAPATAEDDAPAPAFP